MAKRSLARRSKCVSRKGQGKWRFRGGPTCATLPGRGEAGFTLLELIIVCAIISIVAGLALASFSGRDQAGRLASDVARRIRERRASAIRINALTQPTQLEFFSQPPITIDFSNLSTTGALVVEGDSSITDGTVFIPGSSQGGGGYWSYVYQGAPLQLPSGWRIAATAMDLAPIPVIPLGTPATAFNFTSDGRLDASSLPASSPNTNPNVEAFFPAVYLTDGHTARAVSVHPSGLIEIWQYDEAAGVWRGFGDRTVTLAGGSSL